MAGNFFRGNDAVTGQDAERDGEVECGAFLFDIRRRETDRDLIGRDVKAAVLDCCADPFPGFFNTCIREAHQDQLGQAICDVDLNIYGKGMDADSEGAFDSYHKDKASFLF